MSDLRTPHSPIVIDRVERSRGDGDSVRLRLAGRRLVPAAESELEALLVVQVHGQRHRFAASRGGDEDPSPGSWRASFTVPDWAVPVEYGPASLWVGGASVPVPPVGTRTRIPTPGLPAVGHGPEAGAPLWATASSAEAVTTPKAASTTAMAAIAASAAEAEAGRAGPLADALLRETVAALHAELEQRSGREAALDGALERARAELVARTASQTELEATHAELRAELARLVEAVAEQQAEFERRLDEARERHEAELAQTRGEADRSQAELAQARDQTDRERSELTHARGEAERARSELAQARADADRARAELLGTREQEADIVHARQQLASVSERLAATAASDQMRAQETAALREQLAITTISRDAALAEASGLRAELSRLGSELAVTREQAGADDGELGVAHQLLKDARALTAQLRGESRS